MHCCTPSTKNNAWLLVWRKKGRERWRGQRGRDTRPVLVDLWYSRDLLLRYLFPDLYVRKAGNIFPLPVHLDPPSKATSRPWEVLKKCRLDWIICWIHTRLAMGVMVTLVAVVAVSRRKNSTARCSVTQAVLVLLACRMTSRPSKPSRHIRLLWQVLTSGSLLDLEISLCTISTLYGEKGRIIILCYTAPQVPPASSPSPWFLTDGLRSFRYWATPFWLSSSSPSLLHSHDWAVSVLHGLVTARLPSGI